MIYRGSRFDWTGQIAQIVLDGKHTFCTGETGNDADQAFFGRGLYNEFGIDMPFGYDDCPVQGQFHKPGVGLLRKENNDPYDFFHAYAVQPADVEVGISPRSAQFITRGKNVRGYAYQLEKQIILEENGFTIAYKLINTGELPIVTSEYVHNFLSLNRKLIDDAYSLVFSFDIHPDIFSESVNPENKVLFKNRSLHWRSNPSQAFFFSHVNPPHLPGAWWELRHTHEKIAIRETSDFPVYKVNIWGTGHVVSPEVFFFIDLQPGSACTWQRQYELFTIDN
jgi:hypothetical protein